MAECGCEPTPGETKVQQRMLWIALALNATMFVAETTAGVIANSTGLIADGLDMLADAAAYGIALAAVGRSGRFKANAAMVSGVLLLLLGIGVIVDVVRRLISGAPPEGAWMIAVAAVALAVNATVLRLLSKQRQEEVHIRHPFRHRGARHWHPLLRSGRWCRDRHLRGQGSLGNTFRGARGEVRDRSLDILALPSAVSA